MWPRRSLQGNVKRFFSVSCRAYVQSYARSTLNTQGASLSVPTSFVPKSVLIAATPSLLPQLFPLIEDIHLKDIQVVVAGVDTIPISSRSGVSELWLDEEVEFVKPVEDHHSHSHTEISSTHSLNNWETTKASLKLRLDGADSSNVVEMQLANTLFATGLDHTLFYLDKTLSESGQLLEHLEVVLPKGVVDVSSVIQSDRWTPLYDDQTFVINNCVGNLVKQVDGKGASSYLEKNSRLMDLGSKDTQVYVKIYKKSDNFATVLRYEVIAGGGGWGAKAEMLALTPHAKIAKGDRIEFFMLRPSERFDSHPSQEQLSGQKNQLVFECSHEELSYSDTTGATSVESVVGCFGCGSEKGFKYNLVLYASAGEKVSFSLPTNKS